MPYMHRPLSSSEAPLGTRANSELSLLELENHENVRLLEHAPIAPPLRRPPLPVT